MKKIIIGTIAACVFVSTSAFADPIAERKETMKGVGMAMGALVKMLKGQVDYDAAVAKASFETMNKATVGFSALFPVGSETGGETTAKATIWSDMAGFETGMTKFAADTAEAMAANPADLAAFKPVFGKVAGNCKACHETYRVPKL